MHNAFSKMFTKPLLLTLLILPTYGKVYRYRRSLTLGRRMQRLYGENPNVMPESSSVVKIRSLSSSYNYLKFVTFLVGQ